MSYVITGASGTLGRLVAEETLTRVEPSEVVLVTRDPGKLADFAARGAQVRTGDFNDPASLESAFDGGDRLLLISTDALGSRVDQHRNAIDAAKTAGVSFIAYTSIPNPSEENPVGVNAEHRQTEEMIETSGIAHTFLRNSIYTEMDVPAAQGAIATGKFHTNRGDGLIAFVSRNDCALAAAAVLTADGQTAPYYDITGPELVSAKDLAAVFTTIGGREVELVQIDDAATIAGLVEHGVPAEAAPVYASFGQGIREGHLELVSDSVEQLTGRKPESVESVFERELQGVSSPA